jgi:hypothetical protein
LQFFTTNPFDILNDVGANLTAPNISGGYAATYSVLVSTTYENVFEAKKNQDTASVLKEEQASIIYDI